MRLLPRADQRRRYRLSGLLFLLLLVLVGLWHLRRAGEPPTERRGKWKGDAWAPSESQEARPGGGRGTPALGALPVAGGRVDEVVDGDTIALSSGQAVRYAGIDAPEFGEPLWPEAREENRRLVLGQQVELTRSGPDIADGYGRLLAIVHVIPPEGRNRDGSARRLCANTELVNRGLASVYIRGPESLDEAFLGQLLGAQRLALSERRGLWRGRLERARDLPEPLVATHYRIHLSSCGELKGTRPRPVRSVEAEFRAGRSLCRSCRPLGEAKGRW